jgi:16S rRNA (guanine(966)-N(2))-methyltransferase RsmD
MRERAFAVLGERVVGARFLDLFAGTGAVGFEALSRGAAELVLVEQHRAAARLISANRAALGIAEHQAQLLVRPARRALADLARHDPPFDLAWADPPFASWQSGLEALVAAFSLGVLSGEAIACLECPAQATLAELPPQLVLTRELKGGASRVLMLCQASK